MNLIHAPQQACCASVSAWCLGYDLSAFAFSQGALSHLVVHTTKLQVYHAFAVSIGRTSSHRKKQRNRCLTQCSLCGVCRCGSLSRISLSITVFTGYVVAILGRLLPVLGWQRKTGVAVLSSALPTSLLSATAQSTFFSQICGCKASSCILLDQ